MIKSVVSKLVKKTLMISNITYFPWVQMYIVVCTETVPAFI